MQSGIVLFFVLLVTAPGQGLVNQPFTPFQFPDVLTASPICADWATA
jgi:hypothetical protein